MTTKEVIHSFIIRFWIESREIKDAEPIWRGVIEAVEHDERVYFDQLDKMTAYFAEYIEKIGAKINKPST